MKYVGLNNPGSTCYMNSLLQTLFMTKHFRSLLFKWKYDQQLYQPQDSIPLQLQLVFLQLSQKEQTVSTKNLIKSFQWSEKQSFQQHDVQQFYNLLLQALQMSMKQQEYNLVREIYVGQIQQYVVCLQCNEFSIRRQRFQSLILPLSDIGGKDFYQSLQQSMQEFLRPQILQNNNKYMCEHCKKRQDAEKGIRITKLPQILVLNLNRFTLNMQTFQRQKINNYLSFPEILNMNSYHNKLYKDLKKIQKSEKKIDSFITKQQNLNQSKTNPSLVSSLEEWEHTDFLFGDLDLASFPTIQQQKKQNPQETKEPQKKEPLKQQQRANQIKLSLKEGQFVYQLFSVMVHSGGAYGGHYFVFIRSFEDEKWYSFNDKQVSRMQYNSVKGGFGNKGYKCGDSINFGTSAYMLFYKKVGVQEPQIQIPPFLQQMYSQIKKKRIKMKQERAKIKPNCRVFYKKKAQNFQMQKTSTLKELFQKAKEFFKFQQQDQNLRLRIYAPNQKTMLRTFTNKQNQTLQNLNIQEYSAFIVQIKQTQNVFQQYDPYKIPIKLNLYKPDIESLQDQFLSPISILVNDLSTVQQLIEEGNKKLNGKFIYLKRQEYSYTRLNNQEYLKMRILVQGKFFSGIQLFLQEDKSQLMWPIEFQREKFRNKWIFTNPIDESEHYVFMDTRKTIYDLKQKIATKLNLDQDQFILKPTKVSPQFKNIKKIKLQQLRKYYQLYVQLGKPSSEQLRSVRLAFGAKIIQKGIDGLFFDHWGQFTMQFEENVVIKDMKELIIKQIEGDKQNVIKSVDKLRLRIWQNERFREILRNEKRLNQYKFQLLVIQKLEQEQNIRQQQVLLYVKRWDPQLLQLHSEEEVIVQRRSPYQQLAIILSQVFEMLPQEIEVCHIRNIVGFMKLRLCEQYVRQYDKWMSLSKMKGRVEQNPWFIQKDGQFVWQSVIISIRKGQKNRKVQQKQMRIAIPLFNKQIKKQPQLKITVKKKGVQGQQELLQKQLQNPS